MEVDEPHELTDPLKNPSLRGALGRRVNGRPFHSVVIQDSKSGGPQLGTTEGETGRRMSHVSRDTERIE